MDARLSDIVSVGEILLFPLQLMRFIATVSLVDFLLLIAVLVVVAGLIWLWWRSRWP